MFLDSSVLISAVDTSPEERARTNRARDLIREDRFGTSAQVVQEFYTAVTRGIATPLPVTIAARWVDRLLRMPFVPTDAILTKTALIRAHAHGIAYWDAAVLSAAETLGAATLYSEHFEHGRSYGSVQVINPFK